MNTERLHHLITIMQRVIEHDKKFDMTHWIDPGATVCGSVCCALGWATFDEQCMAEGLHMVAYWKPENVVDDSDDDAPAMVVELTTPAAWAQLPASPHINFTPGFNGMIGFEAAMMYYDISYAQAEYLFDPFAYNAYNDDAPETITTIEVIIHIRKVLNGYQPNELRYPEDDDDGR